MELQLHNSQNLSRVEFMFVKQLEYSYPSIPFTLQEGIVKPDDPALRDVSAHCLAEFVKWSQKQNRQGDRVSRNLKSILKRIFSLCQHPSAFKRLGEF